MSDNSTNPFSNSNDSTITGINKRTISYRKAGKIGLAGLALTGAFAAGTGVGALATWGYHRYKKYKKNKAVGNIPPPPPPPLPIKRSIKKKSYKKKKSSKKNSIVNKKASLNKQIIEHYNKKKKSYTDIENKINKHKKKSSEGNYIKKALKKKFKNVNEFNDDE